MRRQQALASQVSFLLQRVRQIQGLHQQDLFRHCLVSDFMFEKDRLFAGLTLDADELALYDALSARLAQSVTVPQRVVYLYAPPGVLMQRVRRRGRGTENSMIQRYLERVCTAYAAFFSRYDRAPVITVDADAFDLVGSERDFRRVAGALEGEPDGVHLAGSTML